MVQRTQIILEDDIDGGAADETVTFSFDGTSYEIDLSSKNAKAFRDALATYVGHARKVSRTGRRAGRGSSSADTAAIREWARQHGHKVSDRGRISSEVMAAYEAR
jgi:hypothetical protein